MTTLTYLLAVPELEADAAPTPDPEVFGTVWLSRDSEGGLLRLPVGSLDIPNTALFRLWKQFESDETWAALFHDVFGDEFAELESTLEQIEGGRYIGDAEGAQLDEIGYLVGRSRSGMHDDLYRMAIIATAVSLVSHGTLPDIVDIAVRMADGSNVAVSSMFPAAIRVHIDNLTPLRFGVAYEVLQDIAAASISMLLSTSDPDASGGFASTTGVVSPVGVCSSTTGAVTNPRSLFCTTRGF